MYIKKLNRELGLTIIIAEHRLEDVIPVSDKLMVMDKGKIIGYDLPEQVIEKLSETSSVLEAMPAAARLYHRLQGKGRCPVDVRGGRSYI